VWSRGVVVGGGEVGWGGGRVGRVEGFRGSWGKEVLGGECGGGEWEVRWRTAREG